MCALMISLPNASRLQIKKSFSYKQGAISCKSNKKKESDKSPPQTISRPISTPLASIATHSRVPYYSSFQCSRRFCIVSGK